MTSFGRVFRTTAFKLSLIYLAVFTAFSGFLIAYLAFNTGEILSRTLRANIDEEVRLLREQYTIGGVQRLVRVVEARSRRPGAGVYLVTDFNGNPLAGNIAEIPPHILNDTEGRLRPASYERLEATDPDRRHRALVRVFALDGGHRVVVGRDVGEREEFRGLIRDALRAALIVMIGLGLVTWWFVNRRVLKRIDQVSLTSERIMAGDLSQRLSITGSGDEFDRLGGSLNAMLGRIDELMRGLKEVSDNIAHDLKTPLTRLRNRVELTLNGEPSEERYREALEATIVESDGLIQTFNALLLIARVEAGSNGSAMAEIDVGEVVGEAVELYEPVAEDEGVTLTAEIAAPAMARASRELVAQVVTNLIDNALKYGRPPIEADGLARAPVVKVGVRRDGADVLIEVADNGAGVPEADRERVLHRFVRLEASRNAPGSGLGLALVAAVARLHGGAVELADAGPGLIVRLRWPA
ncbi:MAG: HAMP domain-containing protein [Hyphomicrobiaceae bacterium]|nr:HAMP domain-containing protein [Hyphomicrobiaceae bacterium]